MADSDYMSSDDFQQALKALGYLPSDASGQDASQPNQSIDPSVSPYPSNSSSPANSLGAQEELDRANDPNDKSQEFPEAKPSPSTSAPSDASQPDQSQQSQQPSDQSVPAKAPDTSYPLPGSPQSPTGPVTPQPTSLSQNPQLNDQALVNAQNQAQEHQLFSGIGDALATAAMAASNKPVDEQFFKEQMANAQQPVTNLEARRQLFEKNVLVAGQTADAAVKQMNAQQQEQLNNPNSSSSQFIKSLLASQYSQQTDKNGNKIDITKSPGWKDLSGSDALEFQKMIASQEHMQMLKDQLLYKKDQANTKSDTHDTDKQNAATQKLSQALNTFRGDTAAQQANVGLLSSDKAMQLINSTPDLNNLNEQQYALLRQEIGKIATGGAATEASSHDIQAQTLQSRAAKFWQGVSGNPTGAQLGQFIQQNKDYLQNLNNVNHNYIDTKRQNILNDYKSQVPEETYNDFQSRYLPKRQNGQGNMPAANPDQSQGNQPLHKSVIQNGVTYNWNPNTGKYE